MLKENVCARQNAILIQILWCCRVVLAYTFYLTDLKNHTSVTTSLSFVDIGHIGYIKISPKIALSEISCLFTFCPYLINDTERN